MVAGVVLQIIMIVSGLVLLDLAIMSLAKRKMTEPFCLTWGLIAIIIIVAGFLLRPSGWTRFISPVGLCLVLLIGFCVVYIAYFMSSKVSDLMRKNMELAMQVSLLNQENTEIRKQLTELSKKINQEAAYEEDSVCD